MDTEVNYMGKQLGFGDGTPVKNLDAKARVTLPVWQYLMHVVTHCCWEGAQLDAPLLEPSWTLPMHLSHGSF